MNQVGFVGVAVAVGVAATLQAAFTGIMTERLGPLESVFITYGGGGLLVATAVLVARGGNLGAWRDVPTYALFAGVAGLIIVGGLGLAIPRLGVVGSFAVILATQFILGTIVDHFGWLGADVRPIDPTRLIGIATLMVGSYMVIR